MMPRFPSNDDVRFVRGGESLPDEFTADARRADIPGNTSSTVSLEIGKTFYGSLETVGDHDWLKMELAAGEYQVRIHGVGTTELNDPFMTLRDGSGADLGSVDDYEFGYGGGNVQDPYAVLTINTGGTFFLDLSSFVEGSTNDDTGDYIVTLVSGGASDPLVHTLDEIAWQLTNNFWEDEGGPDLPGASAFNVGGDGTLTYNVSALTAAGRELAVAALKVWSDVTGITFQATTGGAELTFDDSDSGVNAYAGPTATNGSTILASQIMITTGWLNQFGTDYASYSYETYIHEIGHALGLGHGGNYNGTISDNYYTNDSLAYSIMSYSQVADDHLNPGGPSNNPTVDASFRSMQTVAIADVIAIQNLYGDDTNTRTGNTTYGFNANTGNDALDQATDLGKDMFFLVYDDAGRDTLDFSGFGGNQRIDLRAEASSDVLGGRQNVWVARGVAVENAVGGRGNDILVGNDGRNILTGGVGKDTIDGGAGNDRLFGSKGDDELSTGGGNDIVVAEKKAGLEHVEDFADGRDRLDLSAFDFANFAAVRALADNDRGTLVLDLAKTTIELAGFSVRDFDSSDVIL